MIKFCTYLRRRFITLESSSNALLIVSDDFSIVNLRKKKKKEKKKGKESFAGKKFRNTIFRECDFTTISESTVARVKVFKCVENSSVNYSL